MSKFHQYLILLPLLISLLLFLRHFSIISEYITSTKFISNFCFTKKDFTKLIATLVFQTKGHFAIIMIIMYSFYFISSLIVFNIK